MEKAGYSSSLSLPDYLFNSASRPLQNKAFNKQDLFCYWNISMHKLFLKALRYPPLL